jgi:hypothetical protein
MTDLDEAIAAAKREGAKAEWERITAILQYARWGCPEQFELAQNIAFESRTTVAEAWKKISEARR